MSFMIEDSWINDSALFEFCFTEHNVVRNGNEGYNGYHTFLPICSGGVVSIFVQNSIEYLVRADICLFNTHIKTISIELDKEK